MSSCFAHAGRYPVIETISQNSSRGLGWSTKTRELKRSLKNYNGVCITQNTLYLVPKQNWQIGLTLNKFDQIDS